MMVVKRDGTRKRFDREKIKDGIMKACEKRPVSMDKIEEIAEEIAKEVHKKAEREVKTTVIGKMVMDKLYELDEVLMCASLRCTEGSKMCHISGKN